jgi:hypothetical protein
MATKTQIDRIAQRIEALAPPPRYESLLMGWGNETEDNVIARLLPHRPELARRPRHRMRFAFFRWMTCDEAIGREWEAWMDAILPIGNRR